MSEKVLSETKSPWLNISHISSGFTAVLVGYTSSVVIIIQAATAAGASPLHIASWLLVLGLTVGMTSIVYSWHYKIPVLMSWSTPGAAMLVAAVGQYHLPQVIGAFIISGLLIFLTGLISPLSRLLEKIPTQLATAMLGAILIPFCIKAFTPVTTEPELFVLMIAVFFISKRYLPRYAMMLLLIAGIGAAVVSGSFTGQVISLSVATPLWVMPVFDWSAIINLSLPLYIITMLSQNLPGFAMLRSYDYQLSAKPVFIGSGVINMLAAPFGGFSLNLAAISAAICMNEDVDPDHSKRYRSAMWAGVFFIIAGLWATAVVTIFLALPKEVSNILAGLALLGTLLMCMQSAFSDESLRESSLYTFLVTLSGITLFGIGSTLWGLIAGLVHKKLMRK
ncbi:benzoate/H(+) symporter BenE family transporter [Vibrio gangliei]|uniref:benzoate/H(+) symporter BenE family transporter n=1 Tax=Vibrio gangliei TaxID=2077090 RepID=UPI000D01C935|nr:benzoate/H(+) symporter BenE family transporter [Vibrio gangliei]